MHSFTSSSDRISVQLRWPWIGAIAVAIAATVLVFLEVVLAGRGYVGNAQDSPERWQKERKRASSLGKNALIIIGASRIQLGLDLDTLRDGTGLEPVQLAIDATSFEAVLAGLATDPTVRGTVLVDFYDAAVGVSGDAGAAVSRNYAMRPYSLFASPFDHIEGVLTENVRTRLAAYADGASPLNSLLTRVLGDNGGPSYLTTRPDRSRLADYTRVDMPGFYLRRVARHLGLPAGEEAPDPAMLASRIAALRPRDNTAYLGHIERLRQTVGMIEARGGRVVFLAMPTSGMIREIDEKLYPRERFWDPLMRGIGAPALRAADVPALKDLQCPDGSHLDMRDRARATRALLAELKL